LDSEAIFDEREDSGLDVATIPHLGIVKKMVNLGAGICEAEALKLCHGDFVMMLKEFFLIEF